MNAPLCICNIEESSTSSRSSSKGGGDGGIDQYHHLDDEQCRIGEELDGRGELLGRQLNRTPLCLISSFKMAAMHIETAYLFFLLCVCFPPFFFYFCTP